jgi:hypothetical protein
MASEQTLLLFDVDGVLIRPVGYKLALRRTLDHFAHLMGQPPQELTAEEVALFEASGLSNEWDSVPMCVGALIISAVAGRVKLVADSFGSTLDAIRRSRVSASRPDFASFSREAHSLILNHINATEAVRQVLRKHAPQQLHLLLEELLRDVYSMETPTTRVFQHYTLGHRRYELTYSRPAEFETTSTLEDDIPLLDSSIRDELFGRANTGKPGFCIFTARPSRPQMNGHAPDGNFPPEAEIGLELLKLDGVTPLVAGGQVDWLAAQRGEPAGKYVKPSPVQALAAMGAALSGDVPSALQAAAEFTEDGTLQGPLLQLRDQPTRVVVFEDTLGGIRAVRKAVELLSKSGITVRNEAVGIAEDETKHFGLTDHADRIVSNINDAVRTYL